MAPSSTSNAKPFPVSVGVAELFNLKLPANTIVPSRKTDPSGYEKWAQDLLRRAPNPDLIPYLLGNLTPLTFRMGVIREWHDWYGETSGAIEAAIPGDRAGLERLVPCPILVPNTGFASKLAVPSISRPGKPPRVVSSTSKPTSKRGPSSSKSSSESTSDSATPLVLTAPKHASGGGSLSTNGPDLAGSLTVSAPQASSAAPCARKTPDTRGVSSTNTVSAPNVAPVGTMPPPASTHGLPSTMAALASVVDPAASRVSVAPNPANGGGSSSVKTPSLPKRNPTASSNLNTPNPASAASSLPSPTGKPGVSPTWSMSVPMGERAMSFGSCTPKPTSKRTLHVATDATAPKRPRTSSTPSYHHPGPLSSLPENHPAVDGYVDLDDDGPITQPSRTQFAEGGPRRDASHSAPLFPIPGHTADQLVSLLYDMRDQLDRIEKNDTRHQLYRLEKRMQMMERALHVVKDAIPALPSAHVADTPEPQPTTLATSPGPSNT